MDNDPRAALFRAMAGSGPNFRKLAADRYERACVQFLLNRLAAGRYKLEIIDRARRCSGTSDLRLMYLCDTLPDFPFYLASKVLTKSVKNVGLFEFFKNFKERPLYKAFVEAYRGRPAEFASRSMAVIVKWPYVPDGLVIHDNIYSGVDGVRMVYVQGRREYVIEPLAQFVVTIKHLWQ